MLVLVGTVFGAAIWYFGKRHVDLVVQTFNRDLAQNLINERQLISGGYLDQSVIKKVFTEYMNINPNIEIYLLDDKGEIVSFSAPAESVKLEKVSLNPIRAFLENEEYEPVVGDDPRNPGRRKAFSAAPINTVEGMYGYLYVVLRGNDYEAVERALEQRYLIRLGLQVLLISLLVGLIAGLLVLWRVTRPVSRLTQSINQHRRQADSSSTEMNAEPGNELRYLEQSYEELTERIQQQFERLEQTDVQRRDLVANISHDLRTPLASVVGYLEVLKEKSGKISTQQQIAYLDVAFKNAKRLSQLIDDLFELARLEAGGLTLKPEPFSVTDLATAIVAQQLPNAVQRGMDLTVEISESLPIVIGDLNLIQRVLENLVSNAIQHNETGTNITLCLERTENGVKVSVFDDGEPIEDTLLRSLFDRFQHGVSRDETKPGIGLGLSIAKQILLLHGSEINLSNIKNKGKAFCFQLKADGNQKSSGIATRHSNKPILIPSPE